jgi:CIC family chloride channel protein
VLAFGYSSLQAALEVKPDAALATAGLLFAIAVGKIFTTGLTIGSGGSGGVFGPSMVIGGCSGAALGVLMQHATDFWPGHVPHPAACAVVGMAGFFAAAAKTPFSTLVMVSEMTGGYPMLLPALWVCVIAFMLSDQKSIYSAQVESRAQSPAHRGTFVRTMLTGVTLRQLVPTATAPTLSPGDSLGVVVERLSASGFPLLPVVDADQRLVGVVDLDEITLALQMTDVRPMLLAADLMRTDIVPLVADDPLDDAMQRFVENDVLALPIVESLAERRVVGLVRRFDVASAYLRCIHGQASQRPTGEGPASADALAD